MPVNIGIFVSLFFLEYITCPVKACAWWEHSWSSD